MRHHLGSPYPYVVHAGALVHFPDGAPSCFPRQELRQWAWPPLRAFIEGTRTRQKGHPPLPRGSPLSLADKAAVCFPRLPPLLPNHHHLGGTTPTHPSRLRSGRARHLRQISLSSLIQNIFTRLAGAEKTDGWGFLFSELAHPQAHQSLSSSLLQYYAYRLSLYHHLPPSRMHAQSCLPAIFVYMPMPRLFKTAVQNTPQSTTATPLPLSSAPSPPSP